MKNNPFTLTFGKQPDSFISRLDNTSKVIDTFTNTSLSQTYLIEGIRGSGKTVLMTTIAKELKRNKDWIVVNLNPSLDLLDDMARRLNDECETIPNFFSKGFDVSFAGFGIGVKGNDNLRDSISVIKSILDVINKKGKKVLITIDEVLDDKNMRVFASQFQIFVRENYPIYLIMTGLFENINEIQNDPALTFLLRSPKIKMEPLSILQIIRKYKEIFELEEDKAKELALLTKGYAFAYQALGVVYWDYKESKNKDYDFIERLDEMLDEFVYRKIWSSLSDNERKIILSIDEEIIKAEDICKKTEIKINSYSKYRDALIKKGYIESPKHGYISLTLPRLNEVFKKYV